MKLLGSTRILILSFFVACFLWLYVKLGSRYQEVIPIPLHVINVKDGYGIASEIPDRVSVMFEADGMTLLGLRYFYDVKYVLDLTAYKENTKFILSEHLPSVKLPPKVAAQILSVASQDTFRIRTEKLITKIVPIRVNVDVSCAAGYVLVGGFRVRPDAISVTCPESYADSVAFVPTEHGELSDLDMDREIKIKLAPSANKNVQFRQTEITVALDIQRLGEIELDNLPVRLINVPSDLNLIVQPSTFSIKVRGGVDFLAKLSRDSVQGFIDYRSEERLNHPQPRLTIMVPHDISWSQITPNRFNLVKLDADDFR
jgi:YbbR domain-containing protein